MRLVHGIVAGKPRSVNTKHGERTVMDVGTSDGNFTIWRPANDRAVLGRSNGERVSLAIDSKGKASLVEDEIAKPIGFNTEPVPETTRSAEIADYIQRLGKLYGHCLTTAANIPSSIELEPAQIKDISTTIFIQTVRHFDL